MPRPAGFSGRRASPDPGWPGGTVDGMETLLYGTLGHCPDCAEERLLLPAEGDDGYCCTVCDAAVFPFDMPFGPAAGMVRDGAERLAG